MKKMILAVVLLLFLLNSGLAADGDEIILLQHLSEETSKTQEMLEGKADAAHVKALEYEIQQSTENVTNTTKELENKMTVEMQTTKFQLIVVVILFALINLYIQMKLSKNRYIEVQKERVVK